MTDFDTLRNDHTWTTTGWDRGFDARGDLFQMIHVHIITIHHAAYAEVMFTNHRRPKAGSNTRSGIGLYTVDL